MASRRGSGSDAAPRRVLAASAAILVANSPLEGNLPPRFTGVIHRAPTNRDFRQRRCQHSVMHERRREPGRWLDEADPLTQLLWRQDDIVARNQARMHLSSKTIEHRLNSGRWRRVHRSVYVTNAGRLTRDQRLWAAILCVGPGAVLGGLTAAERCGLSGFSNNSIHVVIPANRRDDNPPPGVVVHRSSLLDHCDVNRLGAPPHTTAARSVVDAASWASTDATSYTLIAAAFQQRLVIADDIAGILHRMPRLRKRALIRQAADDAGGGIHSLPEGLLVRGLQADRLPLPRLQVLRRDGAGRKYYLDGYYEEWRLHLEVDGSQHTDTRSYWKDMQRQNALWIAGDRVLRFPSFAIRNELPAVLTEIRRALRAAGWRE